jgi:hypothetical protein
MLPRVCERWKRRREMREREGLRWEGDSAVERGCELPGSTEGL